MSRQLDPIAHGAAEQLVDGRIQGLAEQIPQGHLDAGLRRLGAVEATTAMTTRTASKGVISGALTPRAPVVNRPASRSVRTITRIVFSSTPRLSDIRVMNWACFMLNDYRSLSAIVKS